MASSQVDPAIFQRTRETLGKVIKKPPLTDKLLGRPPFRYLHDVISEVSKQTSFFNGLYAPKEMDGKSIQDRDDKVDFLRKAVDTLSFTTGELVKVRPSKVVAGHEAEKTNEFLQILGITILKELDSTEAVKKVLDGEKPSDTLTKEKKKRGKDKSSSKERKPADKKGSRSRSRDRPGEERQPSLERGQAARTKPREQAGDSGASLKSKSHRSLKDKAEEPPSSARPTHRPSRTRPPPDSEPPTGPLNEQGDPPSPPMSGDDEGLGSETKLDRPSSAKGARRRSTHASSDSDTGEASASGTYAINQFLIEQRPLPEVTNSHDNHVTSETAPSPPPPVAQAMVPPPQKRPGSARPAPPKIVRPTAEETVARIPSGHSTGVDVTGPSVILDTPGGDNGGQGIDDDDDDDQFVVQDSTPLELPDTEAFLPTTEDNKPEGALTKNIVAMKERLEGDIPRPDQQARSDFPTISEAQRRKEREIVAKEIEKLQSSIQTLCKSANPLGKIMDYVQEDMDSMQKELEMWKTENEKHTESLKKEESITEQELSPLRALLDDLENKVREQVDLISATKANIVRNDEKTQQMLNSMAFVSS